MTVIVNIQSHTTKKKVHNLDREPESATATKGGVEIERQLAEMKQALHEVRHELSRQVNLSSMNQPMQSGVYISGDSRRYGYQVSRSTVETIRWFFERCL